MVRLIFLGCESNNSIKIPDFLPLPFCPIFPNITYMDEIEDFSEKIGEPELGDTQMQIPSELPVLPLRDIVIYPFMIVPLF
ncbi:MAG TPA: hypothetical protein VNI60_08130, partial [Pyrinomonadaceae bacterium]|nr:hypothetical protein [Pyrinomonadaceae bacterium]